MISQLHEEALGVDSTRLNWPHQVDQQSLHEITIHETVYPNGLYFHAFLKQIQVSTILKSKVTKQ